MEAPSTQIILQGIIMKRVEASFCKFSTLATQPTLAQIRGINKTAVCVTQNSLASICPIMLATHGAFSLPQDVVQCQ